MEEKSRRSFLRKAACGAFAIPMAAKRVLRAQDKPKLSIRRDDMKYRRLGRTNLYVSEICLGGSPVPERPVLFGAAERGVNYFDTSNSYMNGNSEREIGRLLNEFGRDKIHVATKFHLRRNWSKNTIIESVETSLKRLHTDYIDVLCIHGASHPDEVSDERVMSAFEQLKKQGKYRFNGLSCHENHHRVVTAAVESGSYDMILLGFNVFDITETEEDVKVYEDYLEACGLRKLIALAKAKDVGIIAMKTLKVGGRRQNLKKYMTGSASRYQAALKWALDNPDISGVATEMLNFKELEEDLAAVGR